MHFSFVRVALCAALGATLAMAATVSEAEFSDLMKSAGKLNGATKKAIEAKDAATVIANAEEYQKTFKPVTKFYQAKKTADAVEMAKSLEASAKQLKSAAKAGNFDEAGTAFAALTKNCGGCHNAHRVKNPDGTYAFK